MALRLIFMGTPEFSVPALTALAGCGHEIVAVYTQPPRPAGRGMAAKKSPVHETADRLGLAVQHPKSLKGEAEQAAFATHNADAAVVVAFGLILPKPVLEAVPLGAWNGHASLLPRWRGAAPIQRAIMAGDAETGICIMAMEEGLDTGPVAMAERVVIGDNMTAGELHDELAQTTADLMVRAMAALEMGQLVVTPQPADGVTYADKISKAEARIDWVRSAIEIHNQIRGLSPFPGAWCEMIIGGKAQRVKLLRSTVTEGSGAPGQVLDDQLTIACGKGAIRITHLQRAGKGAQEADEFLRGSRISAGDMVA